MNEFVFETDQFTGGIDKTLKAKLKDKPHIMRLTGTDTRIYFTKEDADTPPTIYNSGTTLISNYRDVNGEQAIHKWKVDLINKGKDPSIELDIRTNYGTLLHLLYGKILNHQPMDFETLDKTIINLWSFAHLEKKYVERLVATHIVEFQKDVLSFLKWVQDYQVEPLAIELMLKSDKYQVATALDAIVNISVPTTGFFGETYKRAVPSKGIKAGDPKLTKGMVRKTAIIDFKSGKKAFYDKNILQLLLSRKIFEENFPDFKIDQIYNFAPNDWRTTPTYRFTDQESDTKNIAYLKEIQENVFDRGMIEFQDKLSKKTTKIFQGSISIKEPALEDNYIKISLEELADRFYFEYFTSNVKEEEEQEETKETIIS